MRLELKVDELFTRLTNVANKRDSSPGLESSRSPVESTESTPPPIAAQDLESSCYHELIQDGGRPACSIQEQSHILSEPTTRYKAILSWLSDVPDSDTEIEELESVFTRQFARWWNFRKSQWDNRGLGDTEAGVSAFIEASRRKYDGATGYKAMISTPSFDETMRSQWQSMPPSRQISDGQTFSAYKDAVERRLTSHHFTRRLQLRKNPQQQDAWTDWLEYLNYEQWFLERLIAIAKSLKLEYHQSQKKLVRATRLNSNNASSSLVASDFTHTGQRPGAKTVSLTKELKAAQADRDASNKTISDFVKETKRYKRAHSAAYYQRHRVEWAVKEARLLKTEMSQESKMAKNNTKLDTNESKKRRCDDDEDDIPPESQTKRIKRRDSENAVLCATPSGSHTGWNMQSGSLPSWIIWVSWDVKTRATEIQHIPSLLKIGLIGTVEADKKINSEDSSSWKAGTSERRKRSDRMSRQ